MPRVYTDSAVGFSVSPIDMELALDLLAWSERLEETVITFEDFQREEKDAEVQVGA